MIIESKSRLKRFIIFETFMNVKRFIHLGRTHASIYRLSRLLVKYHAVV